MNRSPNASTNQEYRWGFSFIQLVIMLVTLIVWSTGLYIMWYKSHCRLPLEDELETPRGWRAAFKLVHAMEQDLGPKGINLDKFTDSEAKRQIRKRLHGGAVLFEARLENPDYRTWPAFLSWARREKW